jgi:hypothetical protein
MVSMAILSLFDLTLITDRFLDRIAPWVHYVPVQVDLSDVYDTLIFFRGGLCGEGAHPDLAAKIARAGREWSKAFWRKEDMTAYLFRFGWCCLSGIPCLTPYLTG